MSSTLETKKPSASFGTSSTTTKNYLSSSSSSVGNHNSTSLSSSHPNFPNTLGNLPRKPGQTLSTINTTNIPASNGTPKRHSAATVAGVLIPNGNQSPAPPNSISFGKSNPQFFGRIGVTDNSSSSPRTIAEKNKKAFPPLVPSHHPTGGKVKLNSPIARASPGSSATVPTPASTGGRKLGSFNSLAVSANKSYPAVSPKSEAQDENESTNEASSKNRSSSLGSVTGGQHNLRFRWVFWVLHRAPAKKMSEEEFGKAMRRVGSCDTVETFYSLYLHIKRPSSQTPISDLHLFADPIKPVWEDENNVKGGKWTIRLKKGLSDRLWESLMMSLVGGGLERLIGSSGLNEICGVVLSVRKEEDILAVWHRSGHAELGADGKMAKQVKLSLQTVLQLPLNCNLVYKLNADSLASGAHHHSHNHHQHQNQNHNYHHNPSNPQQPQQQHPHHHHNHHHHHHQASNNIKFQPSTTAPSATSTITTNPNTNLSLTNRQSRNSATITTAHNTKPNHNHNANHHYSHHHNNHQNHQHPHHNNSHHTSHNPNSSSNPPNLNTSISSSASGNGSQSPFKKKLMESLGSGGNVIGQFNHGSNSNSNI